MQVSLSQTLEEAVNIAWVYLQRTGELADGSAAAVFLTNTIDGMMRRGQRNRMFLANKAIIKYRAFRENSNIVPIRAFPREGDAGSHAENALNKNITSVPGNRDGGSGECA